jgi:signal transduction histidine kinase
MAEIMLECQLMTAPHAQTRGVKLIFPTVETSLAVRADRIRLQQVSVSLLSHAVNSSKPGNAVVVDCDTRNPECIRVCIRYSGKDSTAGQGAGIGMVLTKRLVELMGGFIGTDSNVGTDGVLWFELRRTVNPPTAASPSSESFVEQAGLNSRKRAPPMLSKRK